MARPPITGKSERLFREQLNAALDYVEGLGGGGGSTDPEIVRDTVAAALVAGSNITITVSDPADTITIAATGGGVNGGTATISFGAAPGSSTASATVTGQTGILSGSRVRSWVQGSTADYNEYEHSRVLPMVVTLGISDVVGGTGFTIQAATEHRLTGDVAVKWEWA